MGTSLILTFEQGFYCKWRERGDALEVVADAHVRMKRSKYAVRMSWELIWALSIKRGAVRVLPCACVRVCLHSHLSIHAHQWLARTQREIWLAYKVETRELWAWIFDWINPGLKLSHSKLDCRKYCRHFRWLTTRCPRTTDSLIQTRQFTSSKKARRVLPLLTCEWEFDSIPRI